MRSPTQTSFFFAQLKLQGPGRLPRKAGRCAIDFSSLIAPKPRGHQLLKCGFGDGSFIVDRSQTCAFALT